jgi:hypothetical protein
MAVTEIVTDLQLADGTKAQGELLAVPSEAVTTPDGDTFLPRVAHYDVVDGVAYMKGSTTERMTLPSTAVGTPAGVAIALSFKATGDPRTIQLGRFVIPSSDEPILFSALVAE